MPPLRPFRVLLPAVPAAAFALSGCATATHTQHYDNGQVIYVDHPNPPNERFTLRGRMDVTTGDSFVKVVTVEGTYLVPRERLISIEPNADILDILQPDTRRPEASDSNPLHAVTLVGASRKQYVDQFGGGPEFPKLYYAGSDDKYDYYYLSHSAAHRTFRIAQKDNSQDHRMPLTEEMDKWRRLQTS